MYSQMNCLIENEYIQELSKKKIIYVFPNELPNWKRIHKGTSHPKKTRMYSQMNCLIENDYIKGTFPPKKTPMYSQMNCLILEPWNPNTLFRGVQTYIIILMSGDFKATPFARLFFGIFWKGLVRKSTIWALLIFLHSRTFQARFGVWSLLLPAQRVLRASERVWERVQLGKELRNKF